MTDNETVNLFSPGCLGTCWHGKYHYLEPWCGCAHDCVYCYAKTRGSVLHKLAELNTRFEKPVPLLPEAQLLEAIKNETAGGGIKIVKLSRFTDIFTPPFATNGLAHKILETLVNSPVERIIITTKGVPSEETIRLMIENRAKFSYNLVAKPDCGLTFEPGVLPAAERLAAAQKVCAGGVKTTVHMDPLIPGFEDTPQALAAHFDLLKKYGLNRVMFSYLLLNQTILNDMTKAFGAAFTAKLNAQFDPAEIQILPKQADTFYASMKPELKAASVKLISAMLTERGFDFVLCSLKSGRHAADCGSKLCDGSFYA